MNIDDLKEIITYHDTEKTIKKEVFFKNKDGKIHGVWQFFRENKVLYEECTYKDGKKDGLCQKFYKNGNIWIECTYKDGELDGLYKWFDNDGNLISTIIYENGIKIK
jgi:antitoxin component YwqK of YwqJK toxin-antitoxin module